MEKWTNNSREKSDYAILKLPPLEVACFNQLIFLVFP